MYSALVTGGSRGIGRAIAETFAENGYDVRSPGRDELDLSSKSSIGSFISRNREGFDVIINNAGINPVSLIEETDEKDIDDIIMVDLVAPLLILRGFVPKMKQRRHGRIVNIGSVLGAVSKPGRSVYSSAKHGIHGLTMTLALELSGFGILVNTVSPGFTLTDMTRQNNSPDEIGAIERSIPAGRMADPAEIARAVFFLGSYGNTYITGQNLIVDGGYSVQ